MRRIFLIPGWFIMLSSPLFFSVLALGWVHEKFGFFGIFMGLLLGPITAFVAPIWKGVSTGNWWMLLFVPLAAIGSLFLKLSGLR